MATAATWRRRCRRLPVGAELALAGVIFAVAPPFSFRLTVLLMSFALLWLWLREEGVRAIGLQRPSSWKRTIAFGLLAGVSYQLFSLYVSGPAIARLTGSLPHLSAFAVLKGSLTTLLLWLTASLTLAGFGEEFVYRGYLLTRIAQLLGDTRFARGVALGMTAVVFGLVHLYQGLTGAISATTGGLYLGGLYIASGRNLWVAVIAHSAIDTVGLVLLFLGKYPGQ
jgi:membrane protease YdiL (CAAX protease family)